ncbi:MAG: CCA tRNA nucleotidyltransferase [Candidatus Pelagibacter sp.]
MRNFLDKIFFRSNNLDYISQGIKEITEKTLAFKIFDAVNLHNPESEIRYVGGCLRKIINREKVEDIDLATNLSPKEVCEVLKKENINYFETGIEHGTITAIIDDYKFEITSLRKDISTDGRHAKVEFSKNWKEDASRRDFTINSIYADSKGNLFDPYDGKNDLEKGYIKFIGETDKRIKEDYLRILRYIRFFLDFSKHPHDFNVIRKLKINIGGVRKLSKERLLNELKKIIKLNLLEKLSKDKLCFELVLMIFPELRHIKIFSKLSKYQTNILKEADFILFLSLMIIDETDNAEYFLYKYNISKKDQNRIKNIDSFYKEKINLKTFTEINMNKFFYYNGKQATIDILNFRIIKSKKYDKNLLDLIELYKNKIVPTMPIKAEEIMTKYQITEGKYLGSKLKLIEEEWVNNNFQISEQQVENIINN